MTNGRTCNVHPWRYDEKWVVSVSTVIVPRGELCERVSWGRPTIRETRAQRKNLNFEIMRPKQKIGFTVNNWKRWFSRHKRRHHWTSHGIFKPQMNSGNILKKHLSFPNPLCTAHCSDIRIFCVPIGPAQWQECCFCHRFEQWILSTVIDEKWGFEHKQMDGICCQSH